MRDQKDLRTVKKGVNKIENQGEYWYKMFQNYQMTDFCKKIRQIAAQIISGTKCDRDKLIFFCRKRGSIRSSWA